MLTVKNENRSGEPTAYTRSSKPLELLTLRDFDRADGAGATAQEPAAAAGSARLGHPDPARTDSGSAPEGCDIIGAFGVIATALMLTYGNEIMEVLFRILGI